MSLAVSRSPLAADRPPLAAIAGLVVVILIAYAPALSAGFVGLDDPQYVVDNALVRLPSWTGLSRVFTEVTRPSTVAGYYQPLTMASLMLDTVLSGGTGGGELSAFQFHLTNVLLHAAAAILLLYIVRLATGGWIVPLIAAGLFALHPVQVESVAWISQRKTVLASALALGSVLCYLHYGRQPRRRGLLIASATLFGLGCLAKPTIVLLPLTLPLLDLWPLRRSALRCLAEKWPFMVIMGGMGWIAWSSQSASTAALATPAAGGVASIARLVVLLCHNLVLYLGNVVWPMSLSPYRIIPTELSLANPAMAASAAGAVAFLVACVVARRRARPLFVGGTAFLVLVLPALGIIRFAETCVADRFVYLPLAFLLLPLAALAADITRRRPTVAHTTFFCMGLFLLPFGVLMRAQQTVWQDSKTLWTHVHDAVPELAKASYELAVIALDEEDHPAAVALARRAVEAQPDNALFQLALGRGYARTSAAADAVRTIQGAIALGIGPSEPWGHVFLAEALIASGDGTAAAASAEMAIAAGLPPIDVHGRLADFAMRFAERPDLAVPLLRKTLELDPDNLAVRWNYGTALESIGDATEALEAYERVIAKLEQRGFAASPDMLAVRDRLRDRAAATTTAPVGQGGAGS